MGTPRCWASRELETTTALRAAARHDRDTHSWMLHSYLRVSPGLVDAAATSMLAFATLRGVAAGTIVEVVNAERRGKPSIDPQISQITQISSGENPEKIRAIWSACGGLNSICG